ncbi:hypothetical protein FMUND_12919 [Fusarium mundagurra]|uniref:Uncharacterized protein n=1 Tax=Fusarium mundagurra TaxID=1567541 RepID=A0A8H5Y246_9HYPO|nr:hypothetical protein FMUND_12919 [Fusarium mundagurra]
MFSAFKISHSPEVTSLIKKHGVNDALFIKNLGYFTNIDLTKVGEQGFTAMRTGVRFWSNYLRSAKVDFLAEHAHTIYEGRGKTGPYSRHDLEFIRWTVNAMKREVATTDMMLAEVCTEHGDILDVEYEMRTEEGMKRLLTGRVKPQREYISGEERTAAHSNVHNTLFIKDEDMDKMTDPSLISTLVGIDLAISRINEYRGRLAVERTRIDNDAKTLCQKKEFTEKRLNMLTEKRGYLKSQKR